MTGEGVFNIQLVQGFWWNGTHITMAGLRIASAHCEARGESVTIEVISK